MINQKLYPDVKLGNGSYSIATDGCFLASVTWGLQQKGYKLSIVDVNNLFKKNGVYAPTNGLISASTIAARVPEIFLEGRTEAWNDARLVGYLSDPTYFVVGEVSGRGIGGTGQHFVYIRSVQVNAAGKISMTWIDDPWDGLENQKVTNRYNKWGNILSLRVFKVVLNGGAQMPNYYPTSGDWKIDLNNPDAVKAAVDTWIKVASGQTVDKSFYEAQVKQAKSGGKDEGIRETVNLIRGRLRLPDTVNSVDTLVAEVNKILDKKQESYNGDPPLPGWKPNGKQIITDNTGNVINIVTNYEKEKNV